MIITIPKTKTMMFLITVGRRDFSSNKLWKIIYVDQINL